MVGDPNEVYWHYSMGTPEDCGWNMDSISDLATAEITDNGYLLTIPLAERVSYKYIEFTHPKITTYDGDYEIESVFSFYNYAPLYVRFSMYSSDGVSGIRSEIIRYRDSFMVRAFRDSGSSKAVNTSISVNDKITLKCVKTGNKYDCYVNGDLLIASSNMLTPTALSSFSFRFYKENLIDTHCVLLESMRIKLYEKEG